VFRNLFTLFTRGGLQVHVLGHRRRVRLGDQRNRGDRGGAKVWFVDRADFVVGFVRVRWIFVGRVGVRGGRAGRGGIRGGAGRDERRDGEHGDGDFAKLVFVFFFFEWRERWCGERRWRERRKWEFEIEFGVPDQQRRRGRLRRRRRRDERE